MKVTNVVNEELKNLFIIHFFCVNNLYNVSHCSDCIVYKSIKKYFFCTISMVISVNIVIYIYIKKI